MSDEHQIDLENMLGEAFFEDLEDLPDYIIKDFIGKLKAKSVNYLILVKLCSD